MDWTTLGALGALSLAVQRVIEFARDLLDPAGRAPRWVWGAVAIGLGIAGVYGSGVLIEGFNASDLARIVTGLFVGGGSNVAHGAIKRLKRKA